jgi:hypothetical protein
MPSKVVRVSDDAGANWYPIPGPSGSISLDGDQLDDTILGQTYESGLTGLITWSVQGDGYYKGFAGYNSDLKKSGTLTAVTGQAMTLVSGKTYRITDVSREVWDWNAALVVYDNAVAVDAADIESIDYLFGRVTFDSGYTVVGPVTIDVSFYPLATFGRGQDYTLTQTTNALDDSHFQGVQANGGFRMHAAGLRTVTLEVNGIHYPADGWQQVLSDREAILIEINPDGNNKSRARGWFRLTTVNEEGNVGDNEMESLSFVLSVADAEVDPFGWDHASDTTLPTAIVKILNSFESQANIMVQYLYDGIAGFEGDSVVTDCSLSSGIDDMTNLSFTFTGDGELTAA